MTISLNNVVGFNCALVRLTNINFLLFCKKSSIKYLLILNVFPIPLPPRKKFKKEKSFLYSFKSRYNPLLSNSFNSLFTISFIIFTPLFIKKYTLVFNKQGYILYFLFYSVNCGKSLKLIFSSFSFALYS